MSSQVSRDNHFVSQFHLRLWSNDGHKVWTYRTLVSHQLVPIWQSCSIRGTAFIRDLYTTIIDDQEIDEFEKWIKDEFEDPAQEVLNKVLKDEKLTSLDWERLILFLGIQDVRTPASYIEHVNRWEHSIPEILDQSLKQSVSEVEEAYKEGRSIEISETKTESFKNALNIQITPSSNPQSSNAEITIKVVAGRGLWLENQQRLLKTTARVLLKHKWSIVKPSDGDHWFTSDHPVVRLNYDSDDRYDLKGGWDNPGGNIFMPLSPQHLLFTQIGDDLPDQDIFSYQTTLKIQRFLAQRAFRSIYAHKPMQIVSILRPRDVDRAAVESEKEQWKNWHNQQNEAERWKNSKIVT